MVAIPEHGRLEETSFPRLLLDLYRARFSGTLMLTRAGRARDAIADVSTAVRIVK